MKNGFSGRSVELVNFDGRSAVKKEYFDNKKVLSILEIFKELGRVNWNYFPKILSHNVPIDGNGYIVYEYIHGYNLDKDLLEKTHLEGLGSFIKDMHKVLKTISVDKSVLRSARKYDLNDVSEKLDKYKLLVTRYQELEGLNSRLGMMLKSLKGKFVSFTDKSLLHGDIHSRNIIYSDKGLQNITSLIDWDDFAYASTELDLAKTISLVTFTGKHSIEEEISNTKILLSSYGDFNKEYFKYYFILFMCYDLWLFDRWSKEGPSEKNVYYLQRKLRVLDYITNKDISSLWI